MDDRGHKEKERFFGAAKLVAGLTLVSRVLGMVRDMSIVWLGATWPPAQAPPMIMYCAPVRAAFATVIQA